MRSKRFMMMIYVLVVAGVPQRLAGQVDDPVKTLVGRLELERYKATLKGLAQFGDRRQGTERNRKAVDWIEEQLKSYGCTNTERIKYMYPPTPQQPAETGQRGQGGGQRGGQPAATAAPQRGQAARGQG